MSGPPETLVLASASAARRRVLEAAGLAIAVDAAGIDEHAIKAECRRDGQRADDCARALAERKALHVAARHPGALVIGADQMLEHDGAWLDKPRDRDDARRQLARLRGGTHELVCGVAVAIDGDVLWHAVERARLAMRGFSDEFLDSYIAAMGERLMQTVGGYEIEALGAQLFAGIEGDYFTILGLPLLPLLGFLRARGAIAS